MPSSTWPGLVTSASPFAIPPTAAVEQTNLASDIPGQLYVRGGMRKVAVSTSSGTIVDCFPLERNGKPALLGMRPDGALVVMDSPAYGWMSRGPYEPHLSRPLALASASYTARFTEGPIDDYIPPSPELDPGTGVVSGAADGGEAGTSHDIYIDPSAPCSVNGELIVDGGNAGTSEWSELYAEQACSITGPAPPSPPTSPPTAPPPPATDALSEPRNVSAQFGDASASLDWDAPLVGTATSYIVHVSLDGGATWAWTPAAPTGLQVTFGNESASLSWTAPSGNNAPITQYVLQYADSDGAWVDIP